MKKFVAIPLVAVMLAALAVPALAEGKSTLTETATPSQSIPVMGKYVDEGDTISSSTVYSVDIEWGSMKFIYAKSTELTWDPTRLETVGTPSAKWKVQGGVSSSTGLAANEIRLTNHSNTSVVARLDFNPEEKFQTENSGGGEFSKDHIQLADASHVTAVSDAPTETVTFMPTGTLNEEQTTLTNIGNISVSLEQ